MCHILKQQSSDYYENTYTYIFTPPQKKTSIVKTVLNNKTPQEISVALPQIELLYYRAIIIKIA